MLVSSDRQRQMQTRKGKKAEQVKSSVNTTETKKPDLKRFGFSVERGGAHLSRTMMLEELGMLLAYIGDANADKAAYFSAIEEANCLGKRSGKTRNLTYRHLVDLYALDPSFLLFRALVYFWQRDPGGQPLLALLCAYTRDAILRSTAPFLLAFPEGTSVTREEVEAFIENQYPDRFSKATLKSTAQNIRSTLTQSGHFVGHIHKVRAQATPTAGNVAYALLLGYLTGVRGENLLRTAYIQLLDCSFERAIELAEVASRRGWLVFKRVGAVIEVLFPNLVNAQEMEWLRE